MAKAEVRGLEEVINSIFSRYNSNLRKAIEDAAKKAEEDINLEAKSCLYQYYANYDPSQYNRTDSLVQAFVPYNKVTTDKDGVIASVGVIYDPSKLEGVYYSETSKKPFFNPVDPTWVLQNYLNGIHPRTNAWPLYGDELIYDPVVDSVSPDVKMKEYIQKYKDTFDKNVLLWFARRVTRR